ncbi:MAG TPA: hypothetical protein VMT89_09110, partial [Candidatus Acidoferrales bacterium]|nr:hypothetical protein [Candidatus Acidoferrales bacterium]
MRATGSVVAIGLLAVAWLTAPNAVTAACNNLADTSSTACKNAAKCQAEIISQAVGYVHQLQNEAVNAVTRSQAGALTDAPQKRCIGGSRHGQLCDFNNGSCKSNARKGGPCNTDSDCDGKAGSCDRTKGCN